MKKLITIILTLCMCFTLGISLTACDPEHTHAYTKTIATEDYLKSEATCLSKATYYKSCECGEKGTETFEHGDFAEHDFSLTWTKENGKHWHACQTEGCLVTSNEEVHSYLNGECVCGNTLPITQEEWEALFAIENFDNMTIVASFSLGNTAYEENIYYNNGNEKITVTGYNNVELYCINSTWYTYYVSENTFVETDVFGAEYPYVNLSDSFKNFFSMMKNSYALINYDATEDTYYYIFDSVSFYITVNNGKVACLSTIFNIEGETSVYSYTISNYGTTSFSVPFDPTHV